MSMSSAEASQHPNKLRLLEVAREFLSEVVNLTPGKELEEQLNKSYGPGTPYFDQFSSLIRQAIENHEDWVAVEEIDGPQYRRSRLQAPSADYRYFSITTVYMESQEEYSGQYHQHPYGEINCSIPITPGAELKGMSGWQGAGWTSPGPGTHHYPQVRGGALVALFFLPAGRISYEATPDMPQPVSI